MSVPKPLAFAYARFSDPKQAEGDSLRRQGDRPSRWCAANGARLDEALELIDRGKSGYCRENLDEYMLGEFIKLIGTRVPVDSYLLVEALDRLSRERPRKALKLLIEILDRGVHIVRLVDGKVFRHDSEDDANDLIQAVLDFRTGHGESKLKSERVSAAWSEKRKNAGKAIVTRKVPGWITCNEATGKLELVPERAAVVKAIFQKTIDGMGTYQIAKDLDARGVASWRVPKKEYRGKAAAQRWVTKTVRGILDSVSVTGRYQPKKGTCRKGQPRPKADGPPVEGYFPRVISDADFDAVRRMRRKYSGRGCRGEAPVDLFAKLLRLPGGRSLAIRRVRKRAPVYAPVGTVCGDGTKWVSFLAGVFEAAMLKELAEVRASDVLPGRASARKVERLARRHGELERLYWKLSAKLDDPDTFDAVHAQLKEVGAERTTVAAELAEVQLEAKSPVSESWGAFRDLAGAVAAGGVEARERLRAHLRRTVTEITVLVVPPSASPVKGRPRALVAQVHFAGGCRRLFVIRYSSARGTWTSCGLANTEVVSPEERWTYEFLLDGLDLRDPEHARQYAEGLAIADAHVVPAFGISQVNARCFFPVKGWKLAAKG